MFYVLVSNNFCRLQNFKISILNFEILVNALKLSVVICILLFCLNSDTLSYKNKLLSVLFTHSNWNNCPFN